MQATRPEKLTLIAFAVSTILAGNNAIAVRFSNVELRDRFAFRNPILQKDLNTFGHQQEFRIYNTYYAITNDKILDDPTKEIILPNEFGVGEIT